MRKVIYEHTLNGVYLTRILRDYEYSMPKKHFHDEYEIYYLMSGERYYFIGHKTYRVKKGTIVFIDSNLVHKTGNVSAPEHDRILIELSKEPFSEFFDYFSDLKLDTFFKKYTGVLEFSVQEQKYVEALLQEMHQEMHSGKTGYQLAVMTKLADLLVFSARHAEASASQADGKISEGKHSKVDEVADYIVKHFSEDISLNTIADTFFTNKCYLSRIYKEVTGLTVNEFINLTRMNHAKALLADNSLSISEVAYMCGYKNLTYFEKIFKMYREVTPLKYRKSIIKQTQKRMATVETDTASEDKNGSI